jgi:hypothetical protein
VIETTHPYAIPNALPFPLEAVIVGWQGKFSENVAVLAPNIFEQYWFLAAMNMLMASTGVAPVNFTEGPPMQDSPPVLVQGTSGCTGPCE